jgi:hypothetical protein
MTQEDRPIVVMDINQDPYQLLGQSGMSSRTGGAPRIDISSVVGADLSRMGLPQMLEVLRGVYERKNNKMIYRPRTFRVRTQAGTLSDIQASMYRRFQTDQAEVNRLLDLLTPLIPDADKEDSDAIREMVRDNVNEIVEEAGWLGGPRNVKMRAAFEKASTNLETLRTTFGIDDDNINTAAEAENWSRWITIADIVASMQKTYENLIKFFDRDFGAESDESFGNVVIWLVRSLKMIQEAGVRLQFQLRARHVGMEELATKRIPEFNITIAELLDWTVEVCDKGVVVSSKAGKDGIKALAGDLDKLRQCYFALRDRLIDKIILPGARIPIDELYDEHVQNTIKDIINSIGDAIKIADPEFGTPEWLRILLDILEQRDEGKGRQQNDGARD